jgi:hypothetical protein
MLVKPKGVSAINLKPLEILPGGRAGWAAISVMLLFFIHIMDDNI